LYSGGVSNLPIVTIVKRWALRYDGIFNSVTFDTGIPDPKPMKSGGDDCGQVEKRANSVQLSKFAIQRFHLIRDLLID
jgi:hypothetical protein